MSFAKQWDDQYRADAHMSIWPWSDLVGYVHRHARPSDGYHRVLELGCGAGANIPFFRYLGVDYHAIEGSPAIVAMLHERFPELASKIVVGDFTMALPFESSFDLVVDRSSLVSSATAPLLNGLSLVAGRLRKGGLFIGIDWFADSHYAAREGAAVDSHTRHEFGPACELAGIGPIHFFDKAHLYQALQEAGFEVKLVELKTSRTEGAGDALLRAWWNFVAVKT